jgi:hypothetical protein
LRSLQLLSYSRTPAILGTRVSITVFTTACHHFSIFQPSIPRSVSVRFSDQYLCVHFSPPMCAACLPVSSIGISLILQYSIQSTNCDYTYYAVLHTLTGSLIISVINWAATATSLLLLAILYKNSELAGY